MTLWHHWLTYEFLVTHLTVISSKIILAYSFSKETIASQHASFVHTETHKQKTAAATIQRNRIIFLGQLADNK